MDLSHFKDVPSQPRRTLIVKLKVPLAASPVAQQSQKQLLQAQKEVTGACQQDSSELSAPEASHIQLENAATTSQQSLALSSLVSYSNHDPTASTLIEGPHPGSSRPEVTPLIPVASLLAGPREDATTTAGAPIHESAPESECIRVAKPRPVGESAPVPHMHSEMNPPSRPQKRVSISIPDLLRPMSEEPVSHAAPSQIMATNADVTSAADYSYATPDSDTATPVDEPEASHAPTAPAANMPTPQSDVDMHDMQEAELAAETTATTAAAQTPQMGRVTLKLSPTGMAKLTKLPMRTDNLRDFGRERNPRRNATKAFGEVKTPDRAAPVVKSRRIVDISNAPAAKGRPTKKRGAQNSENHTATKRQKPNGASSPATRSAIRGPPGGTAPIVEYVVPPSFVIDERTREPRPVRDVEGDGIFVQKMMAVLEAQSASKTVDTAKGQAMTMKALLQRATHAQAEDALFLTPSEAMEQLAPGKFWNNPIITAEQQPLPLQTISQFLGEFYEDDTPVAIQDCAAKASKGSPNVRQVKLKAIKDRFAPGRPLHPKPWNLLELATHHEDGFRPTFLNNEDCRLLTKLKIPNAADEARRRTYPAGYKEVEKWALLAQAGALTLPHQDSHGYSTYITVNVGLVGFGWLSSPTPDQRAEWNKTTQRYIEGPWRYVVLKPGQTVFFPAGTVHFVFRLPAAGNTLAFGGHVLRCSNIVHWVRCLLEERQSASVTNEDLTDSSTGYLERVERFVKQARKTGEVARWGGEENIKEFLKLKADFMSWKQKS